MSTLRINRGLEFKGPHPLAHKQADPRHRARVSQMESRQLTPEQFYRGRLLADARAIARAAISGVQAAGEFLGRFVDDHRPALAGQAATEQMAKVIPIRPDIEDAA